MTYTKEGKADIQVAYIGGGSRGWAWGFMADLARQELMQGKVRLYDIDRPAAEANEALGNGLQRLEGANSHWSYETAASLAEALTGADFVVISILPGTFAEMRWDVHTPEKHGIWQSVGDTTGPGGVLRGLRTVPMFVEIAEAIKQHSPEAWVINYTNPMSVCVQTLYTVFPEIKAFGCCHEVFGTQELLADMLADMCGIEGVTRQEIKTNVLGINHFTWFDKASYKGMDLFPLYRQFVDKYYDTGFVKEDNAHWMNSAPSFRCKHRVKFDLFRRYGLIAAAGDRHLAEFVPVYLESPEAVAGWQFALTTVDYREEDLQKRLARSQALATGEETLDLKSSGEEGYLLMQALLGLREDLISNVNIPNAGQIPNLPLGATVETNALFRRDSIEPVMAGSLPNNILPLVSRHLMNNTNIVNAAIACDYKLALAAFMNDAMMTLNWEDGEALFKEMLRGNEPYLPQAWKAYMGR